jgi:osmotically-inducible protein OsmY
MTRRRASMDPPSYHAKNEGQQGRVTMNKAVLAVSGAGLGAGLMFILDPERGRRRRAAVRDRATSTWKRSGKVVSKTSRDLTNRTRGVAEAAKSMLNNRGEKNVPDDVLASRVRSKIGHIASHPSAIEVAVEDSRVKLSGPVLADEVERLLNAVRSISGVRNVENWLDVHHSSSFPGEQEESSRRLGRRGSSRVKQLLTGVTAGTLAVYGVKRRGIVGTALAGLGIRMLSRGFRRGRRVTAAA